MTLRIKLLPTSRGDDSQAQPLTTFLINDTIALDAGSLGYALDVDELARVEHIVLTHAHLDHTASLPTAIAEVFAKLQRPWRVYGQRETLEVVHRHLFNDEVWVDFSKIPLMHSSEGSICFQPIEPYKAFKLNGLRFTAVPVQHPVPTVGYVIESKTDAIVFAADTWKTEEIWEVASATQNLRAVFIECSFPNELDALAMATGHLTPNVVAEEVAKLRTPVPVYCVHLKPSMRGKLLSQLEPLAKLGIQPAEVGKLYEWNGGAEEFSRI